MHNSVDAARLLIEAGADVNAQDDRQDSPLLYAGAEGRLEILTLILKARPDFTVYNRFGGTALIPACERGHVEVGDMLDWQAWEDGIPVRVETSADRAEAAPRAGRDPGVELA